MKNKFNKEGLGCFLMTTATDTCWVGHFCVEPCIFVSNRFLCRMDVMPISNIWEQIFIVRRMSVTHKTWLDRFPVRVISTNKHNSSTNNVCSILYIRHYAHSFISRKLPNIYHYLLFLFHYAKWGLDSGDLYLVAGDRHETQRSYDPIRCQLGKYTETCLHMPYHFTLLNISVDTIMTS